MKEEREALELPQGRERGDCWPWGMPGRADGPFAVPAARQPGLSLCAGTSWQQGLGAMPVGYAACQGSYGE